LTVRGLGPVFVGPDAHWYEAASLLAQHHLSALPVVDREGRYLGLVRRSDLFDRFAGSLSTGSLGAVLIIEVPQRDFSMSQLCHLVEQSDARVLSVSTQGQEQPPLRRRSRSTSRSSSTPPTPRA
jgi:acetoin utilization protein AcuB